MAADLAGWLDYISAQHTAEIELGLARLQQVAQRLALKPFECPLITVAGTNGKGSSITALEKLYTTAGYRTGCYTSPHLTVFNERIRVASQFATDDEICDAFSRIDAARDKIPLTYFEFATLAAFIIFNHSHVDVVLLEVGLGGRLDATNLFPADLALITSISIDHADWLGNDRETIAVEKAGVIHRDKIAVISDTEPPQSLLNIAMERAAEIYVINQDFFYGQEETGWWWMTGKIILSGLPFSGLHGLAQFNNLSGVLMAISALQERLPVTQDMIRKALPAIQLQGRFQVINGQPLQILDVSHNPESIALLADNLRQQEVPAGRIHAVVAMLKDKDIYGSLGKITSLINFWYFAALPVDRGEKPQRLQSILRELSPVARSQTFSDVVDAWEHALKQAEVNDRVVVFGSFHTVGAILERLGLNN